MVGISKRYRRRAGQDSLASALRAWLGILTRHRSMRDRDPYLWALRDIHLQVRSGETVGIVGANGSGKTTLLKIFSGVTRPTEGHYEVAGRLSGLIELGAGFHPDLSGRENVLMKGTILGLSPREVRRRLDDIVAFAELEDFIDMPVKRYSSGMYARLGFAVAAHVDPEILLVDEVLSVGDASFQFKCLNKIRQMGQEGRTIIMVSHNLDVVQKLCPRVIWLDRGVIQMDGPAGEVLQAYISLQEKLSLLHSENTPISHEENSVRLERVVMRHASGEEGREFASEEEFFVEIHYWAGPDANVYSISLGVSDPGTGILFEATLFLDSYGRKLQPGYGVACCRFAGLPLMPKLYQLWGSVRHASGLTDIIEWQPLLTFRIIAPPRKALEHILHETITHVKEGAPIYVDHEWTLHPDNGMLPKESTLSCWRDRDAH